MCIPSGMRFEKNRARSLLISKMCLSSMVTRWNSLRLPSPMERSSEIVQSISANGSTERGQRDPGRIKQHSMGNQRSTFDSLEGRGMTMAIKDLIRSSWKPHAVLGDVDQGEIGTGKWDITRSIHEGSARSEIGAVDADCIAPSGTHAPLAGGNRGRTRAAFRLWKRMTGQGQADLEDDIRLEERFRERARIAHELHDMLLQGFFGASMLLHQAVQQTPADYPSKPALSCALRLVNQAIYEGRAAIQGIHTASTAPSRIEHAFSNLLAEVATGRDLRLRVLVHGKPWTLNPAIQEQLFLIGREAAMNALRHSQATKIEVEI